MTLEEKVAQMIALWFTKADVTRPTATGDFSAAKASGELSARLRPGHAPLRSARRARHPGQALAHAAMTPSPRERRAALGAGRRRASASRCSSTRNACTATWRPEATISRCRSRSPAASTRTLVREVNSVIAREMRAHGSHLALSPVVDIARDPRWGRIEETFGEDPYLCGEMGVAAVLRAAGRRTHARRAARCSRRSST